MNITFPGLAVETRAALTFFVAAPFSGNNDFIPGPLCPDIELSRRVEGGGETESLEREMETERNRDRRGQLRWAKCQGVDLRAFT